MLDNDDDNDDDDDDSKDGDDGGGDDGDEDDDDIQCPDVQAFRRQSQSFRSQSQSFLRFFEVFANLSWGGRWTRQELKLLAPGIPLLLDRLR